MARRTRTARAWRAIGFLRAATPGLARLRLLAHAAVLGSLLGAASATAQTFVGQGPGLSIGSSQAIQSNDAPPNGTVGAAIQAVLPHPTDPNTMYVGGTNGGVWVTHNGGASWTPLSDKQSSLSIASLAFDPTDASRNTLIAGVGITSNGLVGSGNVEGRGGQRIGVLYTTNGGSSWSELGGATLANKSIVGVAARGSTLLAAAAEPHDTAAAGGLYRSVNGGSSFDLVSGTRGLASGPVSSLASDNANRDVFFAAVSSTGIYKSSNGGSDWNQVLALGANRIARVATGPNGAIAVGVYDSSSGSPTSGQLVAIQHSRDGGATWTQLAVPDINAGRQASTDFAIAVDPNNPDIVYVAGDRIADPPYTVTAFRIVRQADGTSVAESLTDGGASDGSTTHADARALAFDVLGRLIQGGDGGLYFRTNPGGTGVWRGLNNPSLALREPYAVAYDSISRRLVMSAQDTGSAYQSAPGNSSYRAVGGGGDGVNAVVNDTTLREQGRSVIYVTSQNLSPLTRLLVDANGTVINQTTFNTREGTSDLVGLEGDDFTAVPRRVPVRSLPFSSRLALNRIDPQRIAIGTNYVYTTVDANGAAEELTLLNLGTPGSQIGAVGALAFGTRDNDDAVLAGSTNGLYLSSTATAGSLVQLTQYTGDAPTSVVFDARAFQRFFAADSTRLWGTVDAGATPFTDLTPNLTPLDIIRPTSVEFISSNGVEALLVGGLNNVANAKSPIAAADSDAAGMLTNWRAFGDGLPNTIVNQMSYNEHADVLAVSLFGRGAWLLYDVTAYFPTALELRFGLADNDSVPDASFLTDGARASRNLVKYGYGTLTIDGTATYTGQTDVVGGRLAVNGDISRSSGMMVGSGGILGGTGFVPSTVVAGTLAPGNSIGTITVNGNLTFLPGSIYQVEVAGTTADLTTVTGTATLSGTTQALFAPGSLTRSYTILSAAGGINGSFQNLTATGLPGFLSASLGYGATDVTLALQSTMTATAGLAGNQLAVARALDTAFNAGPGLGAMPALFGLSNGQLPASLELLAGDNGSVGQSMAITAGGQFSALLANRPATRRAEERGLALAACTDDRAQACDTADEPRNFSAWGTAFGGAQWLNADPATGSNAAQQNIGGGAFGGDYRAGPQTLIGAAVGFSSSNYWVGATGANGRATGIHAGLYGQHDWRSFYVNAALAYSRFDGSAVRPIVGIGTTETERSYATSNLLGGRVEVGRPFDVARFEDGTLGLTPFAAVQPSVLWTPPIAESSVTATGSSGAFGLNYQAQSTGSLPTFLGVQADFTTEVKSRPLTGWVRASWVHEFLTSRSVSAGFAVLPGSTFTVDGARAASDAARFDFGVKHAVGSQTSLFASGNVELSNRGQSLAGMVGLRVVW
ncbi:autotransporter domain-containing protein [Reyranella sp.]|uniref:autotransporter domain-containing protein n=1 Tax=Reyranella sp. TaxID=1929291 RepID=UPI003BABCE6D